MNATDDTLQLTIAHVGASSRLVDASVSEKSVPHVVVALPRAGRYELCRDGQIGRAGPGEAVLAPPHQPLHFVHHASSGEATMAARWIHLNVTVYDAVDLFALMHLPLQVTGGTGRRLGTIADQLLALGRSGGSGVGRAVQERALYWEVVRLISAIGSPRPEADAWLSGADRLIPVLTFMRQHLRDPLEPRRLARQAHLSLSRFHETFRVRLGKTPMQYLKHLRLDRAARLLVTTDQGLSRIADDVGFANPFHLSREFKRRFGQSPSAYRQDMRHIAGTGQGSG